MHPLLLPPVLLPRRLASDARAFCQGPGPWGVCWPSPPSLPGALAAACLQCGHPNWRRNHKAAGGGGGTSS
jgi:hypothetical protein